MADARPDRRKRARRGIDEAVIANEPRTEQCPLLVALAAGNQLGDAVRIEVDVGIAHQEPVVVGLQLAGECVHPAAITEVHGARNEPTNVRNVAEDARLGLVATVVDDEGVDDVAAPDLGFCEVGRQANHVVRGVVRDDERGDAGHQLRRRLSATSVVPAASRNAST